MKKFNISNPGGSGRSGRKTMNELRPNRRGRLGRRDRRQHEVMAKRGLPDFETVQQCSERQQQMARRFERAGELQHEMDWGECEPGFCAATPCRKGCWF